MSDMAMDIRALPVAPSVLGESPLWHPVEQVLYWCDIPGRRLNRFDPASQAHAHWNFPSEPACCAALARGGLLVALRSGIVRFDPATGESALLAAAPYDTSVERFNDGKTDPQGRFWVGTIYEPRDAARAALYRLGDRGLERVAGGVTTSNGLAWSPDGRTMYWADTKAHCVHALDVDPSSGTPSNRREFVSFPPRVTQRPLAEYGGRPDGAAVDTEGCYWVAMFEGARLLRVSPRGEILRSIALPVRCPTMPCFGGADLKTLYVTTARENRPADELAREPLAGRVLQLRVEVPGLPASLAALKGLP
jgi:sugar lactone lactonase YvrE